MPKLASELRLLEASSGSKGGGDTMQGMEMDTTGSCKVMEISQQWMSRVLLRWRARPVCVKPLLHPRHRTCRVVIIRDKHFQHMWRGEKVALQVPSVHEELSL